MVSFCQLLDSFQWSYNPLRFPRFPGDRNLLQLSICPRKQSQNLTKLIYRTTHKKVSVCKVCKKDIRQIMEIFKEEESLFSDLRTIIRRIGRVLLFRFFLKALKLYFSPTRYFPCNCGVPSPQLRCAFPTIVVQLPLNCGEAN